MTPLATPEFHNLQRGTLLIYNSSLLQTYLCHIQSQIQHLLPHNTFTYFGESPTLTFKEGATGDNFSFIFSYVSCVENKTKWKVEGIRLCLSGIVLADVNEHYRSYVFVEYVSCLLILLFLFLISKAEKPCTRYLFRLDCQAYNALLWSQSENRLYVPFGGVRCRHYVLKSISLSFDELLYNFTGNS